MFKKKIFILLSLLGLFITEQTKTYNLLNIKSILSTNKSLKNKINIKNFSYKPYAITLGALTFGVGIIAFCKWFLHKQNQENHPERNFYGSSFWSLAKPGTFDGSSFWSLAKPGTFDGSTHYQTKGQDIENIIKKENNSLDFEPSILTIEKNTENTNDDIIFIKTGRKFFEILKNTNDINSNINKENSSQTFYIDPQTGKNIYVHSIILKEIEPKDIRNRIENKLFKKQNSVLESNEYKKFVSLKDNTNIDKEFVNVENRFIDLLKKSKTIDFLKCDFIKIKDSANETSKNEISFVNHSSYSIL